MLNIPNILIWFMDLNSLKPFSLKCQYLMQNSLHYS